MPITTKAEAIKFAIASVDSAIGNQTALGGLANSIAAYRENIRDTLNDDGASEFEDAAWAAFDAEVAKVAA